MDALKDLKTFLFVLLILAFVWLFTGGPLRPEAKSGWFLFRPQQKHSQKAAKQVSEISTGKGVSASSRPKPSEGAAGGAASTSGAPRAVADNLELSATRAKKTDPAEEFVTIKAPRSNKNPYKITGLVLEGKTGFDIAIGQGALLVFAGVDSQPQQDVFLNPGEKAVIATGPSPIGTSFRLNKCSGYFEEHNDFTPKLPFKCPRIEDEVLPERLNDACLDFIDRLPRCKMVSPIPSTLSSSCQEFLNDKVNYKTCLEVHQRDADFYQPEWRIYLGRSEELWKKSRETITLRDAAGNTIDSVSY